MNIFGKILLSLRKDGKIIKMNDAFEKVLRDNLLELGKSATGDLITSIDSSLELREENAHFNLEANKYLIYIDSGRKPGKYPNFDALSKWLTLKGISQDALFPIANKIKNKGIKATNVISNTILDIEKSEGIKILEQALATELEKTLAEQINLK
tara:strand:+ start:2796 stop:3257 length:462 start_codon:yes stop_codon:yes gene_type:complete